MTGRATTMSMDGSPVSRSDVDRMQEEQRQHAQRQRQAVRVVAAASRDADDCRMLLDILGLGQEVVVAARQERTTPAVGPRRRSHAA